MRGIVHDERHPGRDLHDQAEGQHDAPDPHPVEVLGRRDEQRRMDQADDRQAARPIFLPRFRLVMVVRNAAHVGASPLSPAGRRCRRRTSSPECAGSPAQVLADAPRRVVLRAVVGQNQPNSPAFADRHAAEMGADPIISQSPAASAARSASVAGASEARLRCGASGSTSSDIGDVDGPSRSPRRRAAADEDRLPEELHGELRPTATGLTSTRSRRAPGRRRRGSSGSRAARRRRWLRLHRPWPWRQRKSRPFRKMVNMGYAIVSLPGRRSALLLRACRPFIRLGFSPFRTFGNAGPADFAPQVRSGARWTLGGLSRPRLVRGGRVSQRYERRMIAERARPRCAARHSC